MSVDFEETAGRTLLIASQSKAFSQVNFIENILFYLFRFFVRKEHTDIRSDHNDIIISINNKINSSSNSRGCGFRGKGRKRPIYLDLSGFFLVYPAFIFRLTMFKKTRGKSIPQKNGWKTKNMLKTSLKMWKTQTSVFFAAFSVENPDVETYLFLIFLMISSMMAFWCGSFSICCSTWRSAYEMVEWSRPPNSLPMSSKDICVTSLIM